MEQWTASGQKESPIKHVRTFGCIPFYVICRNLRDSEFRHVYHPGRTHACRTWPHGECSVDAVGTVSKPEVGGFVVLCKGVCEVLSITASTPSVVWRGPRPTTRIVFIFAPTVSSASWAILATTSTCSVNDERTKVAVLNHEDSGTRRHASGRSGRGHSDRLDNPFD